MHGSLSAAAISIAVLLTCAASSRLAMDVQLTPHGVAVANPSRAAFDPYGPPGWRMVDRFHAFRLELLLSSATADTTTALLENVASLARDHLCFGWIQSIDADHIAGEVRCPTRMSAAVESYLYEIAQGSRLTLEPYATGKIRYHFPTFRVLTDSRYSGKTCFRSPPHACPVDKVEEKVEKEDSTG